MKLHLIHISANMLQIICTVERRMEKIVFVAFFMNSDAAKDLDSLYNRMQWVGEEYLLEETISISNGKIRNSDKSLSPEIMYWTRYLYRYWHYYRNESKSRIIRTTDFQ